MLTLVEAYARLKSIRQNLPDQPVPPHYVAEYHEVLDLLEVGASSEPAGVQDSAVGAATRRGGWQSPEWSVSFFTRIVL
jgi:hypothetical protein